MSIADSARAAYGAGLQDRITLRRMVGTDKYEAVNVRARLRSYKAEEISGTILQGDQLVIVFKQDLDDQGWPDGANERWLKGDRILMDGETRTLTVQSGDVNTRRIGTEIIAYVLQARGV